MAKLKPITGKVYVVLEGKSMDEAIEVGEIEIPVSVSSEAPKPPGPAYRGSIPDHG